MTKTSCFRGPFDKWHGKWAETLFKAQRQHLYHIYWSLWIKLGFKKFLWVICKIIGLFVNPLSTNNMYSFLNRGNLLQHFQMQLSQNWKTFSPFFFFLHFLNLDSILKIFKKKMTLIADVLSNLETPKNVVR